MDNQITKCLDHLYRGCQKNVPIEDRFSATNPYAAILFSEHYYDKRYKRVDPTEYFYLTRQYQCSYAWKLIHALAQVNQECENGYKSGFKKGKNNLFGTQNPQ